MRKHLFNLLLWPFGAFGLFVAIVGDIISTRIEKKRKKKA